jgi:glycine betaine/proline transport system permease protein
MDKIIDIGKYIEKGINALESNLSFLWSAIDDGISWIVESMNDGLLAIPFWVIILLVASLAYYLNAGKKSFTKEGFKKGIGIASFIVLGFMLIVLMGYWKETIQTTTLVLVASALALFMGIPIGIWTARSSLAETIIRPILDFMQTMPAFVYLIPAIFFSVWATHPVLLPP